MKCSVSPTHLTKSNSLESLSDPIRTNQDFITPFTRENAEKGEIPSIVESVLYNSRVTAERPPQSRRSPPQAKSTPPKNSNSWKAHLFPRQNPPLSQNQSVLHKPSIPEEFQAWNGPALYPAQNTSQWPQQQHPRKSPVRPGVVSSSSSYASPPNKKASPPQAPIGTGSRRSPFDDTTSRSPSLVPMYQPRRMDPRSMFSIPGKIPVSDGLAPGSLNLLPPQDQFTYFYVTDMRSTMGKHCAEIFTDRVSWLSKKRCPKRCRVYVTPGIHLKISEMFVRKYDWQRISIAEMWATRQNNCKEIMHRHKHNSNHVIRNLIIQQTPVHISTEKSPPNKQRLLGQASATP